MSDVVPPWYQDLSTAIERRIEEACALYSRRDRSIVVAEVAKAIHRAASETDMDCAWLAIMLETTDVPPSDARCAGVVPRTDSIHPSTGDAEVVAEDIRMLATPYGDASPTIAIRSGVRVAWSLFIPKLDPRDRALLAADAVHYA